MKGKRSDIDFSGHQLMVKEREDSLVHILKRPGSYTHCIKYINAEGIMAVTGDFGNWIFCREFHPSADGSVSDGYWREKLQIASEQKGWEYDPQATANAIQEQLDGGLEEYGYTGERLEEMRQYMQDCLEVVDEEFEYTHVAYNFPGFVDHESVIFKKKTPFWLQAVFDGFDEICRRMKQNSTNGNQ